MISEPYRMGMNVHKWKIFEASVELFADHTYYNVSVRDIANSIGMQPGSLYNHFPSKDDILATVYDYYVYWVNEVILDRAEIERAAETDHPHDVLRRMLYVTFPNEIHDFLCKCFIIIISQLSCDQRSADSLISALAYPSQTMLCGVLEKLVELGRIEPPDIDAIVLLYLGASYCSTYAQARSWQGVIKSWHKAMEMIIQQIVVIDSQQCTLSGVQRGIPVADHYPHGE